MAALKALGFCLEAVCVRQMPVRRKLMSLGCSETFFKALRSLITG